MHRSPVFWSYLRWSTPPQEWGDSERRQIEPGRAWAAARGMEFVDDYRDPGISAWTGKNLTKGALGRFIADVGSHPDNPSLPQPRPGSEPSTASPNRVPSTAAMSEGSISSAASSRLPYPDPAKAEDSFRT